jgi:hypothetical protein
VDAFFRTGKLGKARGAGGEGCLPPWTRRLGQVWGLQAVARVCVLRGSLPPPSVVGAGVAEVLVVMAVQAAFWGGRGGLGARRPSGVHHSCGSLCWGGGRRSPWAAFSRSAGMGRCWRTLLPAAPATGDPGPSLGSPAAPGACQRGSRPPWAGTPPPGQSRGPSVQRGAAGAGDAQAAD